MPVYDRESGKAFEFEDENQLNEGIKSGQFGFKKGQKVTVYNPADNDEVFEIPAEEYQNALDMGYRFETGFRKNVREYVDENKGLIGSTKVGVGEFANSMLMSVPEIYMKNTSNPLEWAKINALRDDHEIAGMVGTGLGIGANIYGLAKTGALAASEKVSAAIVDSMAKKIVATVGRKQISDQAAKQAAKGLIARTAANFGKGTGVVSRNMAQGAIEGGLDMVAPALAEASFGNFEEAGESLLIGSAFGGVLGGGIVSGVQGFKKGGEALKDLFTKIDPDTGQSLLNKTALKTVSTATNIPEETLEYAVRNPVDVENAVPFEESLDQVNAAIESQTRKFEAARDGYKNAENNIKTKFELRRIDMSEKAKKPNAELAKKIEEDAAVTKRLLGEASEEADNILANDVGKVFQKQQMLDFYDQAIKEGANDFSEVGVKVNKKLKGLKERLDATYADEVLDGIQLREIMRNQRQDVEYGLAATSFDTLFNKRAKTITKNMSEALKDQSPAYSKLMDSMHEVSTAFENLSGVANPDVARTRFAAALGATNKTNRQLADVTAVENWLESIKKLAPEVDLMPQYKDLAKEQISARMFLDAEKAFKADKSGEALDNFYRNQFPEEWENMRLSKETFERAERDFQYLKPVTSGDVETKMRKFIGDEKDNIKNVELRRAWDELAGREGLGDIRKQIKDRLILDSFNKARTQGSRATLLGATTIGGMGSFMGPIGWALGAAAGAGGGAFLDRYGGKQIKKLIGDSPRAAQIRGLLVAEEQLGKVAREIDNIPAVINSLSDVSVRSAKKTDAVKKFKTTQSAILREIIESERREKRDRKDEKERKESKPKEVTLNYQAWEVLSERFAKLSDPNAMNDLISDTTGDILMGGGPNIARTASMKMAEGLSYLQKEIPKNPIPMSPFGKKQKYIPADYDLARFAEKVAVVKNPMIVFEQLEAGLLTRASVDALQAVYPSLYGRMTDKVMEAATDGEIDISYADKVQLSYILKMPIDNTISAQSFAFYQSVSGTSDEEIAEEEAIEQAQNTGFKADINLKTNTMQTTAQRLGERA